MEPAIQAPLGGLFFLVALLYSSVGHGGGSGYLAVMSLVGVGPEIMRPTALTLNILVAGIATWKFARAGHFSGALFWPLAVASIPLAFVGGALHLPTTFYRPVVGLVLLYAAYRLWRSGGGAPLPPQRRLPLAAALLAGAGIGLLSGLVGVGGGIFLSPLLLLTGWADTRQTLGVSAAFVLVNSMAGLLGLLAGGATLPPVLIAWLVVAAVGGWIGAEYGSRRLNAAWLRRLLALVLVIGGGKMLF